MLMDLCLVVVTILISVPSSPNAPRPTSPMPHHLIVVDTDVVFPLPNSRLYHNQRDANIPVSSSTTLMCSSYWSMKYLIKPLMWQPCLHVHCFLPTAFALYIILCESFSLLMTMLLTCSPYSRKEFNHLLQNSYQSIMKSMSSNLFDFRYISFRGLLSVMCYFLSGSYRCCLATLVLVFLSVYFLSSLTSLQPSALNLPLSS